MVSQTRDELLYISVIFDRNEVHTRISTAWHAVGGTIHQSLDHRTEFRAVGAIRGIWRLVRNGVAIFLVVERKTFALRQAGGILTFFVAVRITGILIQIDGDIRRAVGQRDGAIVKYCAASNCQFCRRERTFFFVLLIKWSAPVSTKR